MAEILAGTLRVDLVAKLGNFKENMKGAEKSVKNLSQKIQDNKQAIQSAGVKIAAAGAVITGIFAKTIKEASNAEEIQSKFFAVFKDQSEAATVWINEFAGATGRSTIELKNMAASMQDTFVPLGFARKEARLMSQTLVELAVDVASFQNKSEPEVLAAFQSAIVGNTEAVRSYGIVITQSELALELLRMGITENIKNVTAQQKAQARLNLIMAGTVDAQGDAIRTAGGFANTYKKLEAQFLDFMIVIGNQLLPFVTGLTDKVAELIRAFNLWAVENEGTFQIIVSLTAGIGAFLLVVGPLLIVLPHLAAGFALLGVSINAALIILVAIAAAIVLIVKHWDEMLAAMKAGYTVFIKPIIEKTVALFKWSVDSIKDLFVWLWEKVLIPFWEFLREVPEKVMNSMVDLFEWSVEQIRNLWVWLRDRVLLPFWEWLTGLSTRVIESMAASWEWFRGITGGVFTWIWDKIKWVWEQIVGGFSWVLEKLGIDIDEMGSFFTETFEGISDTNDLVTAGIGVHWDNVKSGFGTAMDTIGDAGEATSAFVGEKWGDFKTEYEKNLDEMQVKDGEVSADIEENSDSVTETLKTNIEGVNTFWGEQITQMKKAWDTLGTSVIESLLDGGGLATGFKALRDGFGSMMDKVKDNIITNIAESIWDTLKNSAFVSALKSLGNAFVSAFSSKTGVIGSIIGGLFGGAGAAAGSAAAGAAGIGGGAAAGGAAGAGAGAGAGGALGAIGSAAAAAAPVLAAAGAVAAVGYGVFRLLGGGLGGIPTGDEIDRSPERLAQAQADHEKVLLATIERQKAEGIFDPNSSVAQQLEALMNPDLAEDIQKIVSGLFPSSDLPSTGRPALTPEEAERQRLLRISEQDRLTLIEQQAEREIAEGTFDPNSIIGQQYVDLVGQEALDKKLGLPELTEPIAQAVEAIEPVLRTLQEISNIALVDTAALTGEELERLADELTRTKLTQEELNDRLNIPTAQVINVNITGNQINSELDMDELADRSARKILEGVTDQETVNF